MPASGLCHSWPCCTKVPMQSFLVSHAIYAIVLFGVLEAMCIPISSELTFLLGGALAAGAVVQPHPSLALVIIVGIVAEMVGSYIAYCVGRWGGSPLVRRWGRYVLITESRVGRAGGWEAAVLAPLRVDRGRPGEYPAVPVRGPEHHRHDHLHRRALQHRVQPRRAVDQAEPQPLARQLHPGRGRGAGDRRLRPLPAARVPARGGR